MAYTAPPLRRPPAQSPSPYGAANPPLVSPPAAFDPSARPPGGHSANFLASVAANNAGAKARQDAFAAGATPAESVQTPTGPSMGMARIGDQVRYYPQTADSAQTIQARKDARVSGQDAGAAARASSLAGSQQQFDAQHPPLVDPRRIVAESVAAMNAHHATLYDTQGNAIAAKVPDAHAVAGSVVDRNTREGQAATTRAGNDTTRTQSNVAMDAAHAQLFAAQQKRIADLAPAEQQKLQQQIQLLTSQGKLAEVHALLTGEQVQTEQQTRPGKVQGQAVKNQATADANARNNQRLPYEIDKDRAAAFYNTTDPKTLKPIPGAPTLSGPPTINPPPAPVQPIPVPPVAAPVAPPAPAPAQPAPAAPPAAQAMHAPRLNRAVTLDELQATAAKHGISVDDVKRQLGIQ